MNRETLVSKLSHLEALSPSDMEALELAVDERIREIEVENWTPTWDDAERRRGELGAACGSYAIAASQKAFRHKESGESLDTKPSVRLPSWPFSPLAWKPASARRMMEKAVALGLSELSRQIRAGIE